MSVSKNSIESKMRVWGLLLLALALSGCDSDSNHTRSEPPNESSTAPETATELVWDQGSWDELNWQ